MVAAPANAAPAMPARLPSNRMRAVSSRPQSCDAAYERAISEEYLVRLAEAYARFFYQYDAAPVLIVNSDNLNFVDSAGDFDLLLQRIAAMRGAREFFSLGE